jgi:RES domain-containing protein
MRVYRLCRAGHRALDGEGALRVGGRWNNPGYAAVYTSATLSLAALEYLAHIEPALAPTDLVALTIEVPARPIERLDPDALPVDWHRIPEHPRCKALGDSWLSRHQSLGLLVPSAIIPEEQNLILNPRHPRFDQVKVVGERAFGFDPRLLR